MRNKNQNRDCFLSLFFIFKSFIFPIGSSLPSEIWSVIFENIESRHDQYQCALINKQCYTVMNPMLWKELCLEHETLTVEQLLIILRDAEIYNNANHPTQSLSLGKHIRKLDYRSLKSTDFLLELLTCTPMLTDLSIGYKSSTRNKAYRRKYTEDTLMKIPRLLPGITRLYLGKVYLTTDFMEILALNCRQLEQLFLDSCDADSPNILLALVHHQLTTIDIGGSSWIATNEAVSHLCQIKTLQHLSLRFNGKNDDNILRHLTSKTKINSSTKDTTFPLLTTFTFRAFRMFEYDYLPLLDAFIKSHPLLESIDVRDCMLMDSLIATMAEHLPNLRYLRLYIHDLDQITTGAIQELLRRCAYLSKIEMDSFHPVGQRFPEFTVQPTISLFNKYELKYIRSKTEATFTSSSPS